MYCTHFPTTMYFCRFSSFRDDILPHWDLASDTKLIVSRTAFTYVYKACTRCIHVGNAYIHIYTPVKVTTCGCQSSIENMFEYFLLTTIMATIGPINENITPFSLGSQHLKQII